MVPANNNDFKKMEFVPEPTWSLRSLDLGSQQEKLPKEELNRLSRLALLDLDKLPKDFEQDLANMMHMVDQVSDFVEQNPELFEKYNDESGEMIYDSVRGVTSVPFRETQEDIGTPSSKSEQDHDNEQADRVWEIYLEPNTIRQGGSHKYFSISTKKQE